MLHWHWFTCSWFHFSNEISVHCLIKGSEYVCWILGFQGVLHSIWELWTSGLQEVQGQFFTKKKNWVGRATIVSWDHLVGMPNNVGSWALILRPTQCKTALNVVFNATDYLSCWIFVNYLCSVTNTKRKPNIVCHYCKQKKLGIIDIQCRNYFQNDFFIQISIHENILLQ